MTEPTAEPSFVDPTPATEDQATALAVALASAIHRPDRSDLLAKAGAALMIIGFLATVLAAVLSQTTDNPLDQSTDLSLGLAGLAAVGLGAAVYLRHSFGRLLRFWLLRIIDERESGRRW